MQISRTYCIYYINIDIYVKEMVHDFACSIELWIHAEVGRAWKKRRIQKFFLKSINVEFSRDIMEGWASVCCVRVFLFRPNGFNF